MSYKDAVDHLYANGPYTFDEFVRVAQLCDGAGYMKRLLYYKASRLSAEDFKKLLTAEEILSQELLPQWKRALAGWEFGDITHKTPDDHLRVLAELSDQAEKAFSDTFYWSDASVELRLAILDAAKKYAIAEEDGRFEVHKERMEAAREKARKLEEKFRRKEAQRAKRRDASPTRN